MRISELSRRSGVPVATVKFYLREGLLPPGELTSPTQARYDDSHLARLGLIRALTTVGLPLATTRRVLAQLDDPATDPLTLLGDTHELLAAPAGAVDLQPARDLVASWGWAQDPAHETATAALAQALEAVHDAGFAIPPGMLDRYAAAMRPVADAELAAVPDDPAEAIRYVVLGTVLMEPVLLAVRRLAENAAAVERYETGSAPIDRN